MSLDLEAKLRVFFASAPQTVRQIPTLEISHSAMSKTYVLWREPYAGTITTEDGVRTVLYAPFEVKPAGTEGHMDQVYDIRLDTTDIDDDFRREMDLIPLSTTERIRVVFREYLSDDPTDWLSRAVLAVESVAYVIGGAAITAISPKYNVTRTGELYSARDIPMLRAWL
jgi:hypothetical protein